MSLKYTYIGVVFGGASGEHDVSIKSAITIINALNRGKNSSLFKVIPIYIDIRGWWWGPDIADEVLKNKGRCILTKKEHLTGTDRIHEAYEQLKRKDVD